MTTIKFIIQFLFLFLNEFLIFKFVFFSYDNKIKINLKIIIIIFFISLITALSNTYSAPELRLISNYLVGILMFFLIDKINIKRNFFYFSIIMLYGVMVELLISFVLAFFFGSLLEINYYFQPIIVLISYLIWLGSWYLLFKNNKIKFFLFKLEEFALKFIKLEFLFIILFLILDVILVKNYFNLKDHIFFITATINLNLLLFLLFLVIKNKIKLKAVETSNIHLKNNVELYESIIKEHSFIKHNLISDFLSIRSISSIDIAKIIDEKIKKYNNNYSWINNINKIPDGIKGLICIKITEAKKVGVKIVLESKDFSCKQVYKHLSPKNYLYLCEVLDIVINNAIEASELCKNKYVRVFLFQKANKINIEITNPFKNHVDITSIGKINYSTKNRQSGFGLHYINLEKQKNITTTFNIVNDLFITKIIVALKK